MKTSWYQLRKNMEDKRINDEVLTAKKLRENHPELTWTEALRLSKSTWDRIPVL